MKTWTDEECDELWGRKDYSFSGVEKAAEWYRRIIRAVVDEARAEHHADCTKGALLLAVEARREEREACAALFDGEKAAAWFHDIYQIEAHRRGDVRHPDSYEKLKESTKEWDRVLARAAKAAILARDKEPNK